MESQKIINLLNDSNNHPSKFATTKWHVIDSETKDEYKKEHSTQFITDSIKSSLCNYSNAYIFVTGYATVEGGNTDTKVTFKSCTFRNE